jgi:hypothetical protein
MQEFRGPNSLRNVVDVDIEFESFHENDCHFEMRILAEVYHRHCMIDMFVVLHVSELEYSLRGFS